MKKSNQFINEQTDQLTAPASSLDARRFQATIQRWLCLLLVIIAAAACNREIATPAAVAPTQAAPTRTPFVLPTATSQPEPTAQPTPTPRPTPIRPAIVAADQVLTEDGLLTIDQVALNEPGWLAVYTQVGGEADRLLGFSAVAAGSHDDVTISVDPQQASAALVARLHQDAGSLGTFEYPGPDEPIPASDSTFVSARFAVDIQLPRPIVAVSDQSVGEEGQVLIDRVLISSPAWLAIYADDDGAAGPVLGQIFLEDGSGEALVVSIPWRQATPVLHAVLHEDNDRIGRFDYPAGDPPVLAGGTPVVTSFAVSLPPDVFVLDQPVVEGTVQIERVISAGPGWLVVYDGGESEDELGFIIGFAPLADGLNERVTVEIDDSVIRDELFLLLHEDTNPGDEFDFPGSDGPVAYEGRLPAPFSFRTDPGNYLVTRDQPLLAAEPMLIPLAVTDLDAWIVVYADDAGAPGAILGQTAVPPGISRDIEVDIDVEQATNTLYAMLHLNAEPLDQFDYPEGEDTPLQRNRNLLFSPFARLLAPAEPT